MEASESVRLHIGQNILLRYKLVSKETDTERGARRKGGAMEFLTAAPSESTRPAVYPNHSTPFSLLRTEPQPLNSLLTTEPQPLNPLLHSHDSRPCGQEFNAEASWETNELRLWITLRPNRSYGSTCVKNKAGGSLCSLYSRNHGRLGSRERISFCERGAKSTWKLKFIKTKLPLKNERFTSLKL